MDAGGRTPTVGDLGDAGGCLIAKDGGHVAWMPSSPGGTQSFESVNCQQALINCIAETTILKSFHSNIGFLNSFLPFRDADLADAAKYNQPIDNKTCPLATILASFLNQP